MLTIAGLHDRKALRLAGSPTDCFPGIPACTRSRTWYTLWSVNALFMSVCSRLSACVHRCELRLGMLWAFRHKAAKESRYEVRSGAHPPPPGTPRRSPRRRRPADGKHPANPDDADSPAGVSRGLHGKGNHESGIWTTPRVTPTADVRVTARTPGPAAAAR